MITVAVGGRYSIDEAGLAAIVGSLPGVSLVALDSTPPPQVLVWCSGGGGVDRPPGVPPGTALLLLISGEVIEPVPLGVLGLFSKDEAPETLGVAIRQVARGQTYLSPSLAMALLKSQAASAAPPPAGTALDALTGREREVLALLAEGLSNKAIAARLYLSVRTVEGHLASIYGRLGVRSRTEAMRFAMQHASLLFRKTGPG